MNVTNEKKLRNDFSKLYAEFDGFECGDEYFEVIYELSSKLCQLADREDYKPEALCFYEGEDIYPRITQVKVKCGGLRVYAYALSNEMQELIYYMEGC